MTDSKNHGPEAASLQGRLFRPSSPSDLAEAVEQAFDYRGDVTLELSTGKRLEGYVFSREAQGPQPSLRMFVKDHRTEIEVPYREIVAIAFTGVDTASGKSWEAWVAKKESQRLAEADQAAADARSRGHL